MPRSLLRRLPLMQFFQRFPDSSYGFDQFVKRGRIGDADAVAVAEGFAGYACYMSVVKQPHTEVVAAFDNGLAVGFAEVIFHIGEDIECA